MRLWNRGGPGGSTASARPSPELGAVEVVADSGVDVARPEWDKIRKRIVDVHLRVEFDPAEASEPGDGRPALIFPPVEFGALNPAAAGDLGRFDVVEHEIDSVREFVGSAGRGNIACGIEGPLLKIVAFVRLATPDGADKAHADARSSLGLQVARVEGRTRRPTRTSTTPAASTASTAAGSASMPGSCRSPGYGSTP